MRDDRKTNEDGSPRKPWDYDDDLDEGVIHPAGKPIGAITAPRDMDRNTLTEEAVKGSTVVLTGTPQVSIRPHIAHLLAQGYSVAELVLARQEKALRNGEEFDASEVAAYSKVVDAVVKQAREERAQEESAQAQDMTDAELDAFLAEQLEAGLLGSGKDSK